MKKENLRTLIVGIAFSVLFVGVVGIVLLRSAPEIRLDQNTHNAVDDIAAVRQQPDQAEGIILGKVPGQPIEIVSVQIVREGDQAGNLLLQIENKTDKPVTFARYWLVPMPCRQYKIGDLFIDYGHEESGRGKISKGDASMAPHQNATLEVKRDKVERYLKQTGPASMPCRLNDPWEKPALSLRQVRFADGSVWDLSKQDQAKNP